MHTHLLPRVQGRGGRQRDPQDVRLVLKGQRRAEAGTRTEMGTGAEVGAETGAGAQTGIRRATEDEQSRGRERTGQKQDWEERKRGRSGDKGWKSQG